MANLQSMTVRLGDLRRAGQRHEETLKIAEQHGVVSFIRWQRAEMSIQRYWQGRWDEALAAADAFIEEVEAGSPHYMEFLCRHVRGEILLAGGEAEAALAEARRAREVAQAVKDPQALNPALAFEARAQVVAGDHSSANAVVDELLAIWSGNGVRSGTESVDGAWALAELGRSDELSAALNRASPSTLWHEAALRLSAGDFAGAADVYAEMGSVPDEAYARLRAADAFVRAGRRGEADKQLRLALPVFAQLGATAWAAEGQSLLAESA